jgi:catechol 2,3-dioxygenase-like lactoylglutathione lyase family enzyme
VSVLSVPRQRGQLSDMTGSVRAGTANRVGRRANRRLLFGPGHRYHEFYAEHADGPVVLFEVDDLAEARAELVAAGMELVGPADSDSGWSWVHVRGPDGNLYAFASRRTVE